MSDPRPMNCRHRLQEEGKPYPRSSCTHCGRTITTGLGTSCHSHLTASEAADAMTAASLPKAAPELPFNNLTPAEAERLDLLTEECAEVIQAIAKIKRHGFESYNPFDPAMTPNRAHLAKEIGHVYAALDYLLKERDVSAAASIEAMSAKLAELPRWTHHQIDSIKDHRE